ncbi:MAG: hypothetical protein PHX43_07805, partial [Alphaproteobacteria bacterium]|nr:hypothetical protein [Alphaproteobacteria bacterium]
MSRLPKILFFFSLMFFAYCYGLATINFEIFPYSYLRNAAVTILGLRDTFVDDARIPVMFSNSANIPRRVIHIPYRDFPGAPPPDNIMDERDPPTLVPSSAYDLKSLKDDRVQSFKLPSGDERFLMIGGPNYFLDLCPKHG